MAESGKGVTGILGGDFSLGLGQLGAQAHRRRRRSGP